MLNNDYLLPIPFSLAAQIGLEETVLLTFLKQQAYMLNVSSLSIDINHLNAQIPFWNIPILLRLLNNLQMSQLLQFKQWGKVLEIVLLFNKASSSSSSHIQATNENRPVGDSSDDGLMSKMDRLHEEVCEKMAQSQHATSDTLSKDRQSHSRSNPKQQSPSTINYPDTSTLKRFESHNQLPIINERRGITDFDLYLEQKERARQPDQWQPEESTLEQITQFGITIEFALSLQAEFLLRIKEQRRNVRTWNSEFFKYVKGQWQYKQSDRFSYEGTSSSTKFNKTSRGQVSDALSNLHDTDW